MPSYLRRKYKLKFACGFTIRKGHTIHKLRKVSSPDMSSAQSPFMLIREYLSKMENRVQFLESELIRKDAVITRLKMMKETEPQMLKQEIGTSSTLKMSKGIFNSVDLENFLSSPTCTEILRFLNDLNQCARGRLFSSAGKRTHKKIDDALVRANELIDETPPEDFDPQRFGNKAFRKWHEKIAKEFSDESPDFDEFGVYFTRSFGDPHRLDYGTGHEATFLMLLLSIYKTEKTTESLNHFLDLTFRSYLQIVRKLRAVYRLEPAGSHGVWSLDDYHFLPFLFGSSQLCGGSARPKDFLKNPSANEFIPDCDYFSDALLDIFRSKRGPFAEHSPVLHALGMYCGTWEDVNLGLLKMWRGEVLGKFPVAQHFWFGQNIPITWEISKDDAEQVPTLKQTAVFSGRGIDPLAKYFNIDRNSPPTNQQDKKQDQSASDLSYTLVPNGNGIDVEKWKISSISDSKISGQADFEELQSKYPNELDFPFPEMLFSKNFLCVEYSGKISIDFKVEDALLGCKFSRNGQPPDRKLIKVNIAEKWEGRRDQDGNLIKQWRDDFDWTFTTKRLLKISDLTKSPPSNIQPIRTPRRIDYDRLKLKEPILWAKEVILFEDDLFDLGISKLSVKIRVMPSCFFILARFFLRVDHTFLRIVDSRIFHVFGQKYFLIENSHREAEFQSLPKNLDTRDLHDPNILAGILPLIGETETYEVKLPSA